MRRSSPRYRVDRNDPRFRSFHQRSVPTRGSSHPSLASSSRACRESKTVGVLLRNHLHDSCGHHAVSRRIDIPPRSPMLRGPQTVTHPARRSPDRLRRDDGPCASGLRNVPQAGACALRRIVMEGVIWIPTVLTDWYAAPAEPVAAADLTRPRWCCCGGLCPRAERWHPSPGSQSGSLTRGCGSAVSPMGTEIAWLPVWDSRGHWRACAWCWRRW